MKHNKKSTKLQKIVCRRECNREKYRKGPVFKKKGKGKKNKTIHLVLLEGEWERKCQFKEKYFGTMLLPLLRWPISKPYRARMGFWTATIWHYVFSGFSENLSIFKNPFFGEIQARHQNAQNEEGRASTNIFCHFSKSLVLGLSIDISRPLTWKTHSPRSSGHVRPRRTTATLIQTRKKAARPQVTVRNFSWKMPPLQHVTPRRRRVFLGPVAVTAARRLPTKHCKNRDFPPPDAAHPIFERITGSILERIGPKRTPHYQTQQHIYIYIYIYLFGTFRQFLRERCRKMSKFVLTLFDDFLTWPLSAGPSCNTLIFHSKIRVF